MTQDFRSVLRKFEETMKKSGEQSALKLLYESIKEYDTEREYTSVIIVLEKAILMVKDEITKSKLISHLLLRCLITGDTVKIQKYTELLNKGVKTPISAIVNEILKARTESQKFEYILDSIEVQNIFGKFEPISDVPFLEVQNEDAVFGIIDDYYNNGRYIVNLIQLNSNFNHSVNVDIGNVINVNTVEKRRIMKLEK